MSLIQNNNNPIGLLDSGVGGLSIAKCLKQQLPYESFCYIADAQFAPYGELTPEQIQRRTNTIADWLITHHQIKALVIACNTATVNAIEQLRLKVSIPIIGVEPAIKPAALHSQSKKIALLVTQATSINHKFLSLVAQHKNGAQVYIQACPGLVEHVENDTIDSDACFKLLQSYLQPHIENDIDTLVLGCTHYPFLRQPLTQITNGNILIMETALPVINQLNRQLGINNCSAKKSNKPSYQFYSTKDFSVQEKVFSQLWGNKINLEILRNTL